MRVMVLVKSNAETEAGAMPSEELLAAMVAFNEALADAGVIVAGEGLRPSSAGVRVVFDGDDRTVVDGPFAEVKELVAGFWIWDVPSMEDAVAWAKRCPNPTGDTSVLEIRPVEEADDFGEAFTPELREREERLRTRLESEH